MIPFSSSSVQLFYHLWKKARVRIRRAEQFWLNKSRCHGSYNYVCRNLRVLGTLSTPTPIVHKGPFFKVGVHWMEISYSTLTIPLILIPSWWSLSLSLKFKPLKMFSSYRINFIPNSQYIYGWVVTHIGHWSTFKTSKIYLKISSLPSNFTWKSWSTPKTQLRVSVYTCIEGGCPRRTMIHFRNFQNPL